MGGGKAGGLDIAGEGGESRGIGHSRGGGVKDGGDAGGLDKGDEQVSCGMTVFLFFKQYSID